MDEVVSLVMDMTVGFGRGYVVAANNKNESKPIGYIPIDSIFTPVKAASYSVETTRVGQSIDYDRLIIEVKTDGSLSAKEVLSLAAKALDEHILLFVNLCDAFKNTNILTCTKATPKRKYWK